MGKTLTIVTLLAACMLGCRSLPAPTDAGSRAGVPPAEHGPTPKVASIFAGTFGTCSRHVDGSVRCWGNNLAGLWLPDPSGDVLASPRVVPALSGADEVSIELSFACARFAGALRCWGDNPEGQLGDGTKTRHAASAAIPLAGLGEVTQVATAVRHVCAISAPGRVRCWGGNWFGQLGLGSLADTLKIVEVPGLDGVVEVVTSETLSCARTRKGQVSCWGQWRHAGDHDFTQWTRPTPLPRVDAVKIGVGHYHACALTRRGTVSCWGDNPYGQTGTSERGSSLVPTEVSGLSGVLDIAVGEHHTCVIAADRSVQCFGRNDDGQLGDGTRVDRRAPAAVPGLKDARQLALGNAHSCALLGDGSVWCWGHNGSNQTASGERTLRLVPTRVSFGGPSSATGGSAAEEPAAH